MQRVVLKYGLIFGLIIIVRLALGTAISTAFSQALPALAASNHLPLTSFALIFNLITAFYTLIDWVIYFLAGFFAARRLPQIRTAIFTSLWVNGCYTLVFLIITGISLFLITLTLPQYRDTMMGAYISGIITQALVTLILLHFIFGTAIAVLGGLLGARSANRIS